MSDMKFQALASSSAGNAYIVSDNDTRILLECGVTHKNLQKLSGFSLSEFQACLVSHEHKDHAKAVAELISRGMEVYMSQGTAEALDAEAVTLIEHMEQFNVRRLSIYKNLPRRKGRFVCDMLQPKKRKLFERN